MHTLIHKRTTQLNRIEHKLDHLAQLSAQGTKLDALLALGEKIMAAIDDLKANFEGLKTEVGVVAGEMDALKAALDAAIAGGVTDPAVAEVAAGMADLTTRLQDAATRDAPPAPVPAP